MSTGAIQEYDAFLIACYSVHTLTSKIKAALPVEKHPLVLGIFEASVLMSLNLINQQAGPRPGARFGIVSTGTFWHDHLTAGVEELLHLKADKEGRYGNWFSGVETTGMSAGELHSLPPEEVRGRMKDAVKRLLEGQECRVVCLGCAGMAGMDDIVKEAAVEVLGAEEAKRLYIVDGIKAGIVLLEGMARMFPTRERGY